MYLYFPEYFVEIYHVKQGYIHINGQCQCIYSLIEYKRIKNNYGFAKYNNCILLHACNLKLKEKRGVYNAIFCFLKEKEKEILELGELLGKEYAPLLYQFKSGYNINSIRNYNFFIELGGDELQYIKIDNHVAHFSVLSVL